MELCRVRGTNNYVLDVDPELRPAEVIGKIKLSSQAESFIEALFSLDKATESDKLTTILHEIITKCINVAAKR